MTSTSHAMDPQLHTVLRLYGEAEGAPMAEDSEAQALAEARFWMDHRPRVRPDAVTLDAIFAAAAPPAHAQPGARTDRAPVSRRRTRRAALLVATTLSVVAALAVVPLTLQPPPAGGGSAASAEVAALPSASPPASGTPVEAEAVVTPAAPEPAPAPAVLAWEADRTRLDALERKAAELRTRLDSALWDGPAADLSLGTVGPGAYTQASARRAQ